MASASARSSFAESTCRPSTPPPDLPPPTATPPPPSLPPTLPAPHSHPAALAQRHDHQRGSIEEGVRSGTRPGRTRGRAAPPASAVDLRPPDTGAPPGAEPAPGATPARQAQGRVHVGLMAIAAKNSSTGGSLPSGSSACGRRVTPSGIVTIGRRWRAARRLSVALGERDDRVHAPQRPTLVVLPGRQVQQRQQPASPRVDLRSSRARATPGSCSVRTRGHGQSRSAARYPAIT